MNDLIKQGVAALAVVVGVLIGMQVIFISLMQNDLQRIEARLERMEQADNDRSEKFDARFCEVDKGFDTLETTLDKRLRDTIQRAGGTSALN